MKATHASSTLEHLCKCGSRNLGVGVGQRLVHQTQDQEVLSSNPAESDQGVLHLFSATCLFH